MSTQNTQTSTTPDIAEAQEQSFFNVIKARSPRDEIAVFLFALLALIAHGSDVKPIDSDNFIAKAINFVSAWVVIALPFLGGMILGWVLLTFVPACSRSTVARFVTMWVCTALGGLFLWSLGHGKLPHWSFVLVASIASGICYGIMLVLPKLHSRS